MWPAHLQARGRQAQAQQLLAGCQVRPHHLQGKQLDSTPVMALNNNLGCPDRATRCVHWQEDTLKEHPD